MLLRRFTKHVKDQNWFAVWLDVCVVVVGIFLGLQMSEWNQGRQDVKWEREFLQDLRGELERDLEHLNSVIEFQSSKGERLRVAKMQLEIGGEPATNEFAKQYDAAVLGNNTFFPANGVYQSALTSGRIELIRDKKLRYRIMNLYGHYYVRFMYNGEIYDHRVETVALEQRSYFDPDLRTFVLWDSGVSGEVSANLAFLIRENEIYVGLARALEEEVSGIISNLESDSTMR
jgi:hypothetical protein